MAQVPIRQGHSDELPKDHPHNRFNCASSFQSLASHLNGIMDSDERIPDRFEAIGWIAKCIQSRENVISKRRKRNKPIDEGHIKVLFMLRRLSRYILINVRDFERAGFMFLENPQRFLIQTASGKQATIVSNGTWDGLIWQWWDGGRKSTRKNRKTNRKTYRILPKVEGS